MRFHGAKWRPVIFGVVLMLVVFTPYLFALQTSLSGTYIIPEMQSGFKEEEYEARASQKLQRGVSNLFLCWMEIPHQIQLEMEKSREYGERPSPMAFLRGLSNGMGKTTYRRMIGLYEVVTFPYPQGPILPEVDEWLSN